MTDLELLATDDPRLEPADFLGAAVHQLQMADLEDPSAIEHRDTVLDFFLDHPDAAERTCTAGHLTGSALVVDATGGRTLLMLHAKLGRWFQPGGHADGNANLAAVALREAREETGIEGLRVALPAIDVDVHRVEPPAEDPHLHLDARYLVVAPQGASEHANEESLALRWVVEADLDGLEPPVDDSTRRLVRRGLALATSLLA
ncbi:hypothetical protein BH10ACT1_BH10ACT1_16460 [soil metagenome]